MEHRREATYTGPVSEPLSESIQHYLREIYKLHSESGQASVTALARKLDVSNASASAMVKKLDALDLARHERYRGVTLTDSGERVALEVIRHHRLLELYLAQTLASTSPTCTRKQIGSSMRSARSSRRGSTRRSVFRPMIRTGTRSPTRISNGPRVRAALGRSASEEPPLERPQDLLPDERPHLRGPSIALEHLAIVLEHGVRLFQRVLELVALEDVIVGPGLVRRPVLRVHGAADGPERTGLPLDPDDHAFLPPGVVNPGQNPLGEPTVP